MYCSNCGRGLPENGTCSCGTKAAPPVAPAGDAQTTVFQAPIPPVAPSPIFDRAAPVNSKPDFSGTPPPAVSGSGQQGAPVSPEPIYQSAPPPVSPTPIYEAPPPVAPTPIYQAPPEPANPVAYGAPIPPVYAGTPAYAPTAVTVLRGIGSSTLMLCLCVVCSLNAVMALVSTFYTSTDSDTTYLLGYTLAISLILSLPNLLTALGFWLFYTACRDSTAPMLKSTGMSMVKVCLMISLIIVTVIFLLVGIVFLILPGSMTYFLEDYVGYSSISSLFSILGVILILFGAFFIVYTVFAAKSLGSIVGICKTGSYNGNISMFVIVMLYLSAGSSFLSVFSSGFHFASPLASGAYSLLLGLVLHKLHKELQRIPLRPFQPGTWVA